LLISHLSHLSLINFRCFTSRKIEFSAAVTKIFGQNGAGKSSLLEAIYYSCYAASYRAATKEDLIKSGEQDCFVKATFNTQGNLQIISSGFNKEKHLIKINDQVIKSRKELMAIAIPILLQHDDIDIVSGYPEASRVFLQQIVYLSGDAETISHLFKLRAILKRRKHLLANNASISDINIWTEKLLEISKALRLNNQRLISNLNTKINALCNQFNINLSYKINDQYAQVPENVLQKEIELQRNMIGAQLDYLEVQLNKRCAKRFASRGEQRMLTFLLKAASCLLLLETKQKSMVVLLIDDFFAELDPGNKNLAEQILTLIPCQKIITYPGMPEENNIYKQQECLIL